MQAIHDALLHVHILQLLIDRQGKLIFNNHIQFE